MIKTRLVLCSGAELAAGEGPPKDWHVVRLDTLDRGSNTHLRLESVTKAFLRQMPPRLVDLLEIATYVYTADCEASRDLKWDDDGAKETWDREFRFVVPVRDAAFWQSEEVRQNLESALCFLSGDTFHFTFRKLKKEKDRSLQHYLQIEDIEDTPFYQVDRVVMLSGGLDSLAGTLETLEQAKPLVAVSHRPVAQTDKIQRDLVKLLRQEYPVPLLHISAWVNKSGFSSESTQRTRSFLFSALGTAAASVLNAGGVRFYENGVTSLNWPLAPEVLRSRASRTTHPESLFRLQDLYQLVTERSDFAVDNPFVFLTKSEVVSSIIKRRASELIARTCSCTHTMFRGKTQWHCGLCGQCLDRRIAILATGNKEADLWGDYEADAFTGPRRVGYEHNIAANYVRYATDLLRMSDGEIAEAYALELTRAVRCFDRQGEAAQQFIAMQRRHAEVVCQMLREQVAHYSPEIVMHPLDRSCLLSMITRQEHLGEVEPLDKPEAPADAIFRRGTGVWEISYLGNNGAVKDSKGMRILAFLLARPHTKVSALMLAQVSTGGVRVPATDVVAPSPEQMMAGDGLGADQEIRRAALREMSPEQGFAGASFGVVQEVYTAADVREIKRRIREAEKEERQARLMGDVAEAEELQRNAVAMRKMLKQQTDPQGRGRRFNTGADRARKSVAKNILAAIDKLGEAHPRLAAHLDRAVHTGFLCEYAPEEEVTWRTD